MGQAAEAAGRHHYEAFYDFIQSGDANAQVDSAASARAVRVHGCGDGNVPFVHQSQGIGTRVQGEGVDGSAPQGLRPLGREDPVLLPETGQGDRRTERFGVYAQLGKTIAQQR